MPKVNRSIREYEQKLRDLLDVARAELEEARRRVVLVETKIEALEGALGLAGANLTRRPGRRPGTDPEAVEPADPGLGRKP
jgi:hypothetical protein